MSCAINIKWEMDYEKKVSLLARNDMNKNNHNQEISFSEVMCPTKLVIVVKVMITLYCSSVAPFYTLSHSL